jgi:hypothetical protein
LGATSAIEVTVTSGRVTTFSCAVGLPINNMNASAGRIMCLVIKMFFVVMKWNERLPDALQDKFAPTTIQ